MSALDDLAEVEREWQRHLDEPRLGSSYWEALAIWSLGRLKAAREALVPTTPACPKCGETPALSWLCVTPDCKQPPWRVR